jgi:hypothetical protein
VVLNSVGRSGREGEIRIFADYLSKGRFYSLTRTIGNTPVAGSSMLRNADDDYRLLGREIAAA